VLPLVPDDQCIFSFTSFLAGEIFCASTTSGTVMAGNYQNADCSFKIQFIVLFIIILGTFSFPIIDIHIFIHRLGKRKHARRQQEKQKRKKKNTYIRSN